MRILPPDLADKSKRDFFPPLFFKYTAVNRNELEGRDLLWTIFQRNIKLQLPEEHYESSGKCFYYYAKVSHLISFRSNSWDLKQWMERACKLHQFPHPTSLVA